MKKTGIIFTLILIVQYISGFGAEITRDQAALTAHNWMYERINQYSKTNYNDLVIKDITPVFTHNKLIYYIINFENNRFVLVSGIDQVSPVIAYSYTSGYSLENRPPQVVYLMGEYEKEILFHIQNQSVATKDIADEWKRLLSDEASTLQICKSKDVSPLTSSTWDQGKYYNELCPADGGGDAGHVYVGCVATSMAQVMYYYRYPLQGFGIHSYTHPTYGTLTANFGNTTYGWEGMVDDVSKANYQVALISYHAGIAVNMDYGPDGSGAQTGTAAQALRDYFRYPNTVQYVQRMSYSLSAWYNLMRTNLDAKRPLIYAGTPSGGGAGHAWVCDGYQGTDFFHMNWGWSGIDNGYYQITNLNPAAGGTNFNNGQGMIIGIAPPAASYPYHCSGQKVITEFTTGTIEDGSGPQSYHNNNNCSYLLAPEDSVTALKITFNRFETFDTNDVVKLYAGSTTSDPLIGSFSGSTLPAQIVQPGNRMLITFESNDSLTADGWMLTYSSNYPVYCNNQTLTALSGTVSDGSGNKRYNNGTTCQWIIQPSNAAAVLLSFTAFETEPDDDFLKIYDLNTQELLATYSGNTIPPDVISHTGAMFLQFKTDGSQNYQGWEANYTALGTGIENQQGFENFIFYPNPANEVIHIRFNSSNTQDIHIKIVSLDGKVVLDDFQNQVTGDFISTYSTASIAKGIYVLQVQGEKGVVTSRLVIQ